MARGCPISPSLARNNFTLSEKKLELPLAQRSRASEKSGRPPFNHGTVWVWSTTKCEQAGKSEQRECRLLLNKKRAGSSTAPGNFTIP